jgi:hypothetical protein
MDDKEGGNYWTNFLGEYLEDALDYYENNTKKCDEICRNCSENENCILSEGNVIPIRTVKHLRLVVNKPLFSDRKSVIYLSKVK